MPRPPLPPETPHWNVGDIVWLRMGGLSPDSEHHYPAIITEVCDYADTHSDGYVCQQYHADVTFPRERVRDGLVSHCMLTAREGNEEN